MFCFNKKRKKTNEMRLKIGFSIKLKIIVQNILSSTSCTKIWEKLEFEKKRIKVLKSNDEKSYHQLKFLFLDNVKFKKSLLTFKKGESVFIEL